MKTASFRWIEFLIIFILLPVSFSIKYSIWIKLALGVFGFVYISYILLKVEKLAFKVSKTIQWRNFWKSTIIKFFVITIITSLYVSLMDRNNLFSVLINKPQLWFMILIVYSVLSVYPQELLYRTFYFARYKELIPNDRFFIFLNAIIFSLGHLFFKNSLVIVLTFLGGILFALTYDKTKSTLLVSIEHSIYGCWLFTIGMGNMLGFPS